MNVADARQLLLLVNDPQFNTEFKKLIEVRQKEIMLRLATERNIDEVRLLQGAYKELEYLKDIRQRVHDKLKD